jgi:hypothetical protein
MGMAVLKERWKRERSGDAWVAKADGRLGWIPETTNGGIVTGQGKMISVSGCGEGLG